MAYFHYCSTETFRQIFTNKCLWLSSLRSSNDAMEGKWSASVIRQVAEELEVPAWDLQEFANMVGLVDGVFDCLGFCMSAGGDTLSQWRGYADDGRGVSIGFSENFLGRLLDQTPQVRLQPVIYDLEEQKKIVTQAVSEAKPLIELGALRRPSTGTLITPKSEEEFAEELRLFRARNGALFSCLMQLEKTWFSLKNPAFQEENEWRLTKTILHSATTEYRTANGRLVPYTIVPFPKMDEGEPIVDHVLLGPKNVTPTEVFEGFLRRYGLDGVAVSVSEASYR